MWYKVMESLFLHEMVTVCGKCNTNYCTLNDTACPVWSWDFVQCAAVGTSYWVFFSRFLSVLGIRRLRAEAHERMAVPFYAVDFVQQIHAASLIKCYASRKRNYSKSIVWRTSRYVPRFASTL